MTDDRRLPAVMVIVPARDEAEHIGRALLALTSQTVENHEVVVIVNNSSDATLAIARAYRDRSVHVPVHVHVRNFAPTQASAGFAREYGFSLARERFRRAGRHGIIATTDADTVVECRWIEATLTAFSRGADLVAGDISIDASELRALPLQVQAMIRADREYQTARDACEALLDPSPFDTSERHYHHTAASLAISTPCYDVVGGMPRVRFREDIELYAAVRRHDLIVCHDARVRVTTSARMQCRAVHGMGEQLARWQSESCSPRAVRVAHPEDFFEEIHLRSAARSALRVSVERRRAAIQTLQQRFPADLRFLRSLITSEANFGAVWSEYRDQRRSRSPRSVAMTRATDYYVDYVSRNGMIGAQGIKFQAQSRPRATRVYL